MTSDNQILNPSLIELANLADGFSLFAALYSYFGFAPIGSSEMDCGTNFVKLEIAAFNLLKTQKSLPAPDPFQITYALNAIDKEFAKRFSINRDMDLDSPRSQKEQIAWSTKLDSDIVRGSAYPFQTQKKILGIQDKFSKFINYRLGITPAKAIQCMNAIVEVLDKKGPLYFEKLRVFANEFSDDWQKDYAHFIKDKRKTKIIVRDHKLGLTVAQELPVTFQEVSEKITVTKNEWESLLKVFAIGKSYNQVPYRFEDVKNFPLVTFDSGGVLLWDLSNAMDKIFSRFELEFKTDPSTWENYQKSRAYWLEQQTFELLTEIFPKDSVYRTVDYPDPNKPNSTAEVDLVVIWEPFLLFFEAKSGSFRMESQLGDIARLRTDLEKNLEEAFDQAKRASKYFNSAESPDFIERKSKRKLPIVKNRVSHTFLCTVTLERFGQLATQLSMLAPLGLFNGGDYPWAITLSDLEIVVEFTEFADAFLHYISRRLEIQKTDTTFIGGETEFLGAYLKGRLSLRNLTSQGEKVPNMIWHAGFGEVFDEYYGAYGHVQNNIKKNELPENIRKILNELRARPNDCEARHLALVLLDLPNSLLVQIAQTFDEMWAQVPRPGQFRRCTLKFEEITICILASKDLPDYLIQERTRYRARIEKYRSKALKSICFGINLYKPSKYFFAMSYEAGPWSYDAVMAKAIEQEPGITYQKKDLPGRNQPCICGSGKKFKKCCINM